MNDALSPRRQNITLAILLYLFIMAMIPGLQGFIWDLLFFRNWSTYILENGLANAYQSGSDYLPVFQYFLWLFAKIAGTPENIAQHIGYVRILPLLADYWAVYIVYRWLDRKVDYCFLLLCSLLNIAFSYNTVIWGQIDATYAALIISALYCLHRGKALASAIFLVVALNTKLQAIVFVPLWGMLFLSHLHRARAWRSLLYIVPAMVLTEVLILYPFSTGRQSVQAVWKVVSNSVDMFPHVSANACNLWYLVLPRVSGVSDKTVSGIGLSYFTIGLYSFFLASFIALWPVLRNTVLTLLNRRYPPVSREVVWLSAALVAMVFYFFCTQMHERYVHAAFIFLTAYSFSSKRFGIYILFSVAYFLSLERVTSWMKLSELNPLLADGGFIATIFAGCIVWGYILLYRHSKGIPASTEQMKEEMQVVRSLSA